MSVQVREQNNGRVVIVQMTGKLTKEDYEVFVPEIERLIDQFGNVRMLVEMLDFHGWEAAALWEDIKFDAKHFADIDRLALVGDRKWEKGMSAFCKPFTTAKVKYFDLADIQKAQEWITAGLESPV